MSKDIDKIMETASQQLADMDYAASETTCLNALAAAKKANDWALYARIVLPLQECRRQRRVNAADHAVQVGLAKGAEVPDTGCVVFTAPQTPEDGGAWQTARRADGHAVEAIFAQAAHRKTWRIISVIDPTLACPVTSPMKAFTLNKPLDGDERNLAAHWFIAANEALGNAALERVDAAEGTSERIDQLEAALLAVGDHEILHQHLANAARALHEAQKTA
ncbi:MAG: hypothetical protein V3V20_09525 [Algisphaera sp.]